MTFQEFIDLLGVAAFGTQLCEPINCGAGLAIEYENGGVDDSYMLVLGDVSVKKYRDFLAELAATGREKNFSREDCGNIFAEFQDGENLIYTYYTGETETARIILDRSSTPFEQMHNKAPHIHQNTAFMQFSLHYGSMTPGYTCDCGMLYTLRTRDNSLIIIDGGEIEQATEEACDEYMKRIRELTGTQKGEKIRVTYMCTHNHNDHMDFFIKLLKRESDTFEVERVFFNFPSAKLIENKSDCTKMLKQRLKEYAPNAKFCKMHTGQRFRFPDAWIEVLTTHEDILPCSIYGSADKPYAGMNETTTVFRIEFDDTSVIFLGDVEEYNGEILRRLYGKDYLSSEYLQCAHHLINDDRNIYSIIKAKKLLLPQCRFNAQTRMCENRRYLTSLFGEENMYYAGDCTYVFTVGNGSETVECYEHRGYVYDNSGY